MMTQLNGTGEILVREAVPSSDTVRERFASIDGLRALAILAILAYEAFAFAPAIAGGRLPAIRALSDASQGLSLFLMLSGFTLAYPAIVTLTEHGCAYLDLARFAIKRILRIYPAYLLALLLALAIPPIALTYGMPALGSLGRPVGLDEFLRNAVFAGGGLGNDGFRALALVARLYVLFPLLMLLWSRSGRIFAGVLVVAAVLDATTPLHALGIGALVPFMLGMVAASIRAQNLPAYRFGIPLALFAGAAAVAWGPSLARLADAHAAGALRIDPLWSISLFGLLVAVTAIEPLERICRFAPLRLLGAASFGISLVVVPASAFAVRQLIGPLGPYGAAANAVGASLVLGFVLWKLADRSFVDGHLRRDVADAVAPKLGAVLAPLRLARVLLGRPPAPLVPEVAATPTHFEPEFYAPPPRPDAADLAVVSERSGTPQDLAAEILATKKRLAERSAAIFADPKPVAAPPTYQKPGFYRKPAEPKRVNAESAPSNGVPSNGAPTNGAPKPAAIAGDSGKRIPKRVVESLVEARGPLAPHTNHVPPSVPLFNTLPSPARPAAFDDRNIVDVTPAPKPPAPPPAGPPQAMPANTEAVPKRSGIKVRIGTPRPAVEHERLDG